MSGARDPRLGVDAEGNATIEMAGVKATIVDAADAEKATMVVCCTPDPHLDALFPDNVRTTCAICGDPIVHRPNAPMTPIKVCIECARELTVLLGPPGKVTTCEAALGSAKTKIDS